MCQSTEMLHFGSYICHPGIFLQILLVFKVHTDNLHFIHGLYPILMCFCYIHAWQVLSMNFDPEGIHNLKIDGQNEIVVTRII